MIHIKIIFRLVYINIDKVMPSLYFGHGVPDGGPYRVERNFMAQ